MNREHIVSLRLTEQERAALQRRADGSTVSEVIRAIIRRELSLPLPEGVTIGTPIRFVPTPDGTITEGFIWPGGLGGQTVTYG